MPQTVTRTSHVAIMDEYGKVVGYYSARLGRKLLKSKELPAFSAEMEELGFAMPIEIAKKNWKKVDELMEKYNKILEDFKKKGLLIHITPMPGYVFKDGYFQKGESQARRQGINEWRKKINDSIERKGGVEAAEKRAYEQWLKKPESERRELEEWVKKNRKER